MEDLRSFAKWFGLGALVSALVISLRLIATFPFPMQWYGYDFGLYSYGVQHTTLDSIPYFLGLTYDYGNHLFVILNWLRLPQLPSLIFLFYAFQAGSGVMFWLILRKHSKLAAWVGAALFALSIAQTQMHIMFLWKAAYGQLLLLAILYFIQTNRWRWALLPTLLLLITHRTTSIIFLITAAIYSVLIFKVNKKFLAVVSGAIILAAILFFYRYGIHDLTTIFHSSINASVSNGIFLTISDYLSYIWLLIPFAVYGISKNRRSIWVVLLTVALVWIVAGLPFYHRIIQYFDLSIIYFAALSVASANWPKSYKITAAVLLIAFAGLQFYFFKQTLTPQINAAQVEEIKTFSQQHQGAFVLSVSANDAPWLLAYLGGNIRLAAPGLFEDKHSYDDWVNFWQNPQNPSFLNAYPAPLYIYQRSSIVYRDPYSCLQQLSPYFYQYTCQ